MGMGGCVVIGWDMTAALALGQAMRIEAWLLAEVLADVEAVMVRGKSGKDDGND